jgi:hypothetical protein
MAGIRYIDYAEAKAGRIKKRRFIHPLGTFIVERGGIASVVRHTYGHLSETANSWPFGTNRRFRIWPTP